MFISLDAEASKFGDVTNHGCENFYGSTARMSHPGGCGAVTVLGVLSRCAGMSSPECHSSHLYITCYFNIADVLLLNIKCGIVFYLASCPGKFIESVHYNKVPSYSCFVGCISFFVNKQFCCFHVVCPSVGVTKCNRYSCGI